MRNLVLTLFAMLSVATMKAQSVIDIPFEQNPPLTVVATQVEVEVGVTLGSDIVVEGGDGTYTYSWTTEDGTVVSTEQTYTPTETGKYYLIVTDGHDCKVITQYTVTGETGINSATTGGMIMWQEEGTLHLSYDNAPRQVRIVSPAGSLIRKVVPSAGKTDAHIRINNLPKGTLLVVTVKDDGTAYVKKFNCK